MGRPFGNAIEVRQQAILDLVNQLGEVDYAQLRKSFPAVSDVTLRKDLKYLDATKQLIRIHGGARSLPQLLNHQFRTSLHQKDKRLIATKAVQLINPNDSLFITSGSTCVELAAALPHIPMYVFTDGISTVSRIPYCPDIHVEIFGGEVDVNIMRVSGSAVIGALESLHFNTAFLGTPGFNPEYGFPVYTAGVAAVMSKVIERSDRVVVLMDSSKVNYSYSPRMIPFESVDVVISDDQLPPDVRAHLESKEIQVL